MFAHCRLLDGNVLDPSEGIEELSLPGVEGARAGVGHRRSVIDGLCRLQPAVVEPRYRTVVTGRLLEQELDERRLDERHVTGEDERILGLDGPKAGHHTGDRPLVGPLVFGEPDGVFIP